jgi:hypothetical protein
MFSMGGCLAYVCTCGEHIGYSVLYTVGSKNGCYGIGVLLCYKLAKLYAKYGDWRSVYATLYIGEGEVDSWLSDPTNLGEDGTLVNLPDEDTEKFVKNFEKTVEIYRDLYESAN